MRKLAVVVVALLAATAAISAEPGPELVVKYRHKVMEAAGSHMGALAMIIKGESTRAADVQMHATALADIAKVVPELFPEGTGPQAGVQTESKAEIWTMKTEWDAAVKAFQDETNRLVEVSKGGDMAAIQAQFGQVGGSCGDCHDLFRVDDDH